MPMIAFRPAWLETPPRDLSSDDLGAFLVWLRNGMGAMPAGMRARCKVIQRELVQEQKARRSRGKSVTDKQNR